MRPSILIIEQRREVAEALEDVVTSANYTAIVRPWIDELSDLGVTPAAIIVRISSEASGEPAHRSLERLPSNRPPVIAIAWEDEEVAEATRLKCDVVLRAPDDVGKLCETLMRLATASGAAPDGGAAT